MMAPADRPAGRLHAASRQDTLHTHAQGFPVHFFNPGLAKKIVQGFRVEVVCWCNQ